MPSYDVRQTLSKSSYLRANDLHRNHRCPKERAIREPKSPEFWNIPGVKAIFLEKRLDAVRLASHDGMKVLYSVLGLICAIACFAGTTGSFAGTVVDGPESSSQWIYVQGRNHSMRKVDVSRAKIRYESGVPRQGHAPSGSNQLPAGTPVRVTAEQDAAGEWRATEVEILHDRQPNDEKKRLSPTTSQT